MTPSPLPPPVGPGIPYSVAPVMFGQNYTLTPGAFPVAAPSDGVLITYLSEDGRPIGGLFLTIEQAMAFGYALSTAAGMATRFNITDNGKRPPLTERLARLQKGFTQ